MPGLAQTHCVPYLVQRDAGAVEQGGVQQPRSHHPAQVGRPPNRVAVPHVLMSPRIGAAPDRRHVRPRDRLRLPCAATVMRYLHAGNSIGADGQELRTVRGA